MRYYVSIKTRKAFEIRLICKLMKFLGRESGESRF